VYLQVMEKWLEKPKDRTQLPVGRLCVIMGLTILLLITLFGRKASVLVDAGLVLLGVA
jgi:hypothetical protein